jgi:ribosomal protein S12 methylthiotransferase accessory factor
MADIGDQDMYQEIKNCLAVLKKINMEVLILDTMHPELKIPTIYTIIPGAHFRERAAGGDAALFAAKLAAELLEPTVLEAKLADMKKILPEASYYLEFYRGRNFYNQGMTEEALNFFQRASKMEPKEEDQPYLYSFQGCCLRDLARYEDAISVLEKGREIDDERPDLHNILGVCHFKLGAHEKAVFHFKRAVELNPVSAIDYANLAINLERLDRNHEAITNYQTALAMDPSIEFARLGLSKLLEQANNS